MKRLLFVVHRYAPFPGGSENYVRDMAEECVSRGHEVWVFTGEHKGDLNGVHVTSDSRILGQIFDLVIVHGGDVGLQDFVLVNAERIPSPILFMIIKPSESPIYMHAMEHVKYLGCSAPEDYDLLKKHNKMNKCVRVIHGIDEKISVGTSGFREKYNIKTKYMFLSCGGFWPNKAMKELVKVFNEIGRNDTTLVLTGYDNRHNIMPEESEFVKPMMIDDRSEVLSAIKDADLYIMHSFSEGFGLVLLESMLNKTPWASRRIAGANLMKEFGFTYETDNQLKEYLIDFNGVNQETIDNAYEYVTLNHMIKNTVDDIMRLT